MDWMDIDHAYDVPDTPTRLSTQGTAPEENHSSPVPCHSGQQKFLEGSEDQPMVIDSGSRGCLRPQKSSSLVYSHLFRRQMSDKPNDISQNPFCARQLRSVRPSHTFGSSSSSSSQDDRLIDLTERSLHRPINGKISFSRMPNDKRVEFPKRLGSRTGYSSSGMTTFSSASCNSITETGSVNGIGSSINPGEGVDVVGNVQNEPAHGHFLSRYPIPPPNVNRQKRLVRNGCISPNNISKGKQLAGKNINASEDVADSECGAVGSSSPPNSPDIRELVSEDNNSFARKGKGMIISPYTSLGHDLRNNNLHGRSCLSSNEKAVENGNTITHAGTSVEESGGWRSTRNRTRGIHISSADRVHHSVGEADDPRCPSRHQDNRLGRKDKGTSSPVGNDYPSVQNLISPEHVSSQPLIESVPHPKVLLGPVNRPHSTAESLIKRQQQRQRQRQGATSSNCAESSALSSSDPEIVCLSSPAEAANPTYKFSRDNLRRIIEVDESYPPLRENARDEDARARQVEADECLARELQEQLYNEFPVFGVGEIDEHTDLALQQHQDDLNHGVFEGRMSRTNLPGQLQSQSTSNVPRRGSLSGGSTSGRMTRLRNRFAGQARTALPSRARRAPFFPEDMDIDMRMHILGALEEFSNATSGFLPFEHDFNENDYEMLLALDDNNDQHRGASSHHINNLPQSTVQTDNFEEACTICLEIPSIGDTIRHLPCLHKFHKDCINEWLRRRASCPICKSSIT